MILLGILVGLVICVVAAGLLRRQQRLYRESDGPPDLYRADDADRGEPFDPRVGEQVAEDYFAAGRRPQWMRGVRDQAFSPRPLDARPAGNHAHGPAGNAGLPSREEGWSADAFGRHEARWMSMGSPTSLVRDGDRESQDDPPGSPFGDPKREGT